MTEQLHEELRVGIEDEVRDRFRKAADDPRGHFAYPTGRAGLLALGYAAEMLGALPEAVQHFYCGVGNPFEAGLPAAGEQVLDVGCGTGVFLEVLARHGLAAAGVERNEVSARYARSLGHTVIGEDALDYLATQRGAWDGIYCSHFIEHLPVDAAERLISETAAALRPGGVAVFVFPDPESIRSQLLGFWRDPEHVRFYHPELVATMAEVHGLEVEYDNQSTPGRRIVPFSLEPPLPEATEGEPDGGGWWSRSLRRLGIAPMAELQRARARSDTLELAVRRLWEVNQTWAWDDNAVLRFRKRGGI